jgi:ABC-type glycerol-3-phosphate transport system permease component
MEMKGIIIFVIGFFLLSFVVFTIYPETSFAHTSKNFGNTTIEAGWLTEPPLASDLNSIVIQVSKGTGNEQAPVVNALANLTLSVKYGTITKQLDFQPSPTTDGGYEAKILPTRVGPYNLILQGDVKGQKVDSEFNIEDVESKSIFSFPDSSIDTTNANNINQQVQDGMSRLSNDIQESRDDLNMSRNEVADIQQSLSGLQKDSGISYLILLTTLGISIAGIVMAAYLFTLLRFRKGMLGSPQ